MKERGKERRKKGKTDTHRKNELKNGRRKQTAIHRREKEHRKTERNWGGPSPNYLKYLFDTVHGQNLAEVSCDPGKCL